MLVDPRVRVDGEPVAVGDLPHAPLGLGDVEEHPCGRRLLGEDDVLGHRHHRDQHEVLVHHPDARVDRGARRAEPHRLALDQDLALVGVVEPVEDVHQGRLPRAVLAEERVDLALAEVEADVVVRDDPGEALRDVPHLEDQGSLGHPRDSMSPRDAGGWTERRPPRNRVLGDSYGARDARCRPDAICFETASSFAISASRSGASELTLP